MQNIASAREIGTKLPFSLDFEIQFEKVIPYVEPLG